jgi:hypothetical protein
MEKYGSDKGGANQRHNYTEIYDILFLPFQKKPIHFLEVGIYKGASLRAWRDYFPLAHIYGADFNRQTFFTEPRISSHYCDQTSSASLADMWNQLPDMDIVVEDGCHSLETQLNTFKSSIGRVKRLYIIEDVLDYNIAPLERFAKSQSVPYSWLSLTNPLNKTDNTLLVFYKDLDPTP